MVNYLVHLYRRWQCWRDVRHMKKLGLVESVPGQRGVRITDTGLALMRFRSRLNGGGYVR